MSEEKKYHPVFAIQMIPKFTHHAEIDALLETSLEWQETEDVSVVLLPIVDQIPESKRGVVRVFISNKGNYEKRVSVFYNLSGWFSDLKKMENKKKVETINILPNEVWFRDISFTSNIKQGKNYFQLILMSKEQVEKQKAQDQFYALSVEYTQIRTIDDPKQIERSKYLGTSSKPYINPRSIQYWVIYSLYGKRKYAKEPRFLILPKMLGFLAGGAFIALPLIFSMFPMYIIPIAGIVCLLSLLSFISDRDRRIVNLISDLGFTNHKRKAGIQYLPFENPNLLQRYCYIDLNYDFDQENNTLNWKLGANKVYQKIIPEIGAILGIPPEIGKARRTAKRTDSLDKKKKKKGEKNQLEETHGIDFKDETQTMSSDFQGVSYDSEAIITDTNVSPSTSSIKTETSMKPDSKAIRSDSSRDPSVKGFEEPEPFITEPEPFITDSEAISSGDSALSVGDSSITFDDMPVPKKLDSEEEKTKTKKSVKDLKKD